MYFNQETIYSERIKVNSEIMNNDDKQEKFNYSPFIIKKSNSSFIQDTIQTKQSSNSTSPFKMYTPSPGFKEKLSDRFIPCKGTNLFTKFEMATSFHPKDETFNETIDGFSLYNSSGNNSSLPNSSPIPNDNLLGTGVRNIPHSNNQDNNNSVNFSRNKNYINLLQESFLIDETITSLSNLQLNSASENKPIKSKIFRFKSEKKQTKSKFLNFELNEMINFTYEPSNVYERKISKTPFKLLEAPNLLDDFYLNLVDWSSQNDLSVGLLNSVFIWSANKSKVSKLCEYSNDNYVCSVIWNNRGTHVAVGTGEGYLDIWDVQYQKKIRSLGGHSARIGVISWATNVISTGSKDYNILNRDLRTPEPFYEKLYGHKQEVCGLKWSFDETQLASGGNDNKLFIWSVNSNIPLAKFTLHNAAVKGIAWSPHQSCLLASGGGRLYPKLGTADRCIRFWNTNTLQQINYVDTGSQVCNLVFSKNSNELVSTHGYSLNQIIVWKYPTMKKLATLTGHTYRVLYLGISPDGENIVTGAGDESLRFWNVFPENKCREDKKIGSSLIPSNGDVR